MPKAKIVFWDVEHGHASYLLTPNGRHIVIDLGTGSYDSGHEFSPLNHLKHNYRVNQLDYVIITHPHVDHIDDIFNFDSLKPKVLLRPKHLDKEPILSKASDADKPKLEKYFEISERYNTPVPEESPDSPKNPHNWGGLTIKTFVPSKLSQTNLNNHSVVSVFSYAGIKILVPGDNEPPSWHELKEMPGFLDVTKDIDVLLAPHHGRKSGFESEIMKHFNPRLTVVSDGAYCDTSATSRYSDISRGWMVYKRDGTSEKRFCLTTRNDGVITVTFGHDGDNSFLQVEKGK